MDNRDMVFTNDDKSKLVENRKLIIEWIMENVVSVLKEDDRIIIDYGGTYMGMRSYESTTNYHIAVYGKKTSIYTGGERYEGYVGIGEKYGHISGFLDESNFPYDIYPVVDNWKTIKETLLKEISEREEKKKIIYDFAV